MANPLPEFFEYLLLRTGYRRMLSESNDPQDESRLQNIDELLNSVREFCEANPTASVGDYLDSVTLISDVDLYDQEKGITLMTLHAAKGLEFRVVFLAGMEEGVLPHSQSRDEADDIEEERRLCYVGMTRAREQLYCLHALERRIHGQFREQSPSPFLDEIPGSVKEEVRLARPRAYHAASPMRERPSSGAAGNVFSFFKDSPVQFDPSALRTAKPSGTAGRGLTRGARVRHDQFGDGVILRMEGSGDDAKLTVYFDRAGTKKFVAKYAKLTRI
jgi:DNA helicase-2/ATP-dependent DNA helicase PcrA